MKDISLVSGSLSPETPYLCLKNKEQIGGILQADLRIELLSKTHGKFYKYPRDQLELQGYLPSSLTSYYLDKEMENKRWVNIC